MEENLRHSLHHVFELADTKLNQLVEHHPDHFPMYTTHGKWNFKGETWTNWCEGFLGGQMWLMQLQTKQNEWKNRAEHYSRLIEHRKEDRSVHDLGFLFWPTWKRWFDLTGDPQVQQVVLEAGATLAKRFRTKGNYLHSFMGEDSLFIDIMMNVGIIFYTAQHTGRSDLWDIARQHVNTTRKVLVRGDGSTSHEGIFDLSTGEFLHQSTQQGWRKDSSWARGLAWALYGFGTVYGYTHDPLDLLTAESCARFYVEHTPEHGIPPNDWDEPVPQYPYESSAAAIAAGGFWQLASLVGDPVKKMFYKEYSLKILSTLATPEFLAEESGWEGILKHGMYHQRKGLGVDESVMWGDYFFLETVYKVLNHE